MDNSISGKRVIVTAGAAGIGRRIAERFAEQGRACISATWARGR